MNSYPPKGGKPLWRLRCTRQSSNGLPRRRLDVSETLLQGGMDSSRQVTSKNAGDVHIKSVLRIRIRVYFGLLDPDPLGRDPDPDPIIKQK